MDKHFAYSTMVVKAMDDEKREFVGIASTVEPDRVLDVMVPKGAKFSLPLPFLWQHDTLKPIGEIYEARVTDKGIEVKGRIKKVDSPSQLAARLDEAWVSLREGLVRGLSIGFRPIKYAFLESGGVQFDEWDWTELSAVTIPCNAECSITSIKQFDAELRAALGTKDSDAVNKKTPGVSGKSVKIKTSKEDNMSLEKIKGFELALQEKRDEMNDMMAKSLETGETFDEEQDQKYEALADEVKALEEHLKKAKAYEASQLAKAKQVVPEAGQEKAGMRGHNVTVKAVAEQVPGLGVARLARVHYQATKHHQNPVELAEKMYGDDRRVVETIKAAVAPATTAPGNWAGNLVNSGGLYADFAEYLRPFTIVGKFGRDGVPALRTVPFRVPLLGQTSGGTAYWVGEGAPKPLTKFDFSKTDLSPLKLATIAVATMELLEDASPSADVLIRDGIRDALVAKLDTSFIDPAFSANSGVNPASITNSVSPIASSGSDADSVRCDIRALLSTFLAANNVPSTGVLVMGTLNALSLSLMQNPLGQTEFPGIGMTGGTLLGLPVIVSDYIPTGYVALINASDIYMAEGDIMMSVSREASLQFSDTPDNPTTASTVYTNLWQNNMVGFLVEKRVNFAKRRAGAVALLEDVAWGNCEVVS